MLAARRMYRCRSFEREPGDAGSRALLDPRPTRILAAFIGQLTARSKRRIEVALRMKMDTTMIFANLRRVTGALLLGLAIVTASVVPSMAATVVTVNGTPITDVQIDQRLRLFQMEGNRTGRNGATDQLITEAIQMSEAKRLGISVSNAQVDEAFLQIARNLKLSQDRLA